MSTSWVTSSRITKRLHANARSWRPTPSSGLHEDGADAGALGRSPTREGSHGAAPSAGWRMTAQLLPTTMVGSYPRPSWFREQLRGRDIREAFKEIHHEEAFADAVGRAISDQEKAGLDIVTDGQMWFDDYAM